MRILRFDGTGGASGDMILGALIGLGVPAEYLEQELARLPLGHFHLHLHDAASHGVHGVRLEVHCSGEEHHHHEGDPHHHRHGAAWRDIRAMLETSPLPEPARAWSLAVFALLAEAEGAVHGVPPEEVHFHEVGAADSIIDIVGSCLGLAYLEIDAIDLAPLATGSGTFRCAHGVYPIPAPATAEIVRLKQLAVTPGGEDSELLTPTGAALLGAWPHAPLPPAATIERSANSFGHRALKSVPNWLRATLYNSASAGGFETLELLELACNLDDCTGEIIGAVSEELLQSGACDVWTTPAGMKKSRPGVVLHVLASPSQRDGMLAILFRHTTTFGVREYPLLRHQLPREFREVATPYGKVPVKVGSLNGAAVQYHPEFEVCRELARQSGVPVTAVIEAAKRAASA